MHLQLTRPGWMLCQYESRDSGSPIATTREFAMVPSLTCLPKAEIGYGNAVR